MTLAEIEEKLIHGDCSPDMLAAFKTALRRSPKKLRPQHCYTTAAALPSRCFPQAVELIEYSLTLEGTWLDQMRGHSNLAYLYEKQADYENAKMHHALAFDSIEPNKQNSYAADSASRVLVCQLHLNDFTYSDELRRLYDQSQKLDNFSRSFQKCRFYLSLAQILISLHIGDLPTARAAYEQASSMLRPGYEGPLTALLKRKNYIESTGATTEALAFLKRIKKQLL